MMVKELLVHVKRCHTIEDIKKAVVRSRNPSPVSSTDFIQVRDWTQLPSTTGTVSIAPSPSAIYTSQWGQAVGGSIGMPAGQVLYGSTTTGVPWR